MTVRTDRFLAGALVTATGPFDVWDVPLQHVALVKSLRVLNITADPHVFSLWTGDDPIAGLVWRNRTLPGYGAVSLPREDQWEAGEHVWFEADAANAFVVRAGGSLLRQFGVLP